MKHADDTPEAEPIPEFGSWLRSLYTGHEADTMLRFEPSRTNSLDLTHANPSGLTQFLTGRRTRLSTLLRDQPGLRQTTVTAARLSQKMAELAADRGITVGYLASGLASWRTSESGVSVHMSAPVMLVPITLTQRPTRDDFDLQLTGRARLNPALKRWFANAYGITLDAEDFEQAAYATAKLEPLPPLEKLRAASHQASTGGIVVEHRLLISTFADLTDAQAADVLDPNHPVIADLHQVQAGTDQAGELGSGETGTSGAGVLAASELSSLDERDPASEHLVLDLDASQQAALDHIAAGHSLVVSTPPGTGQTQTALAALAHLAAQGKRVLVVAERTSTLADVRTRAAALGLDTLILNVTASTDAEGIRRQLIAALLRAERAVEPALGRIRSTLTDRRSVLADHATSLHQVRDRWGCSPFDAMRALAALTSLEDAPLTQVRLPRSVLDATVNRASVTAELERAAELGAFSKASTESPWYGAKLRNVQDAERAYEVAEKLAKQLPEITEAMTETTEHAQLSLGKNVDTWLDQLELLEQVRDSLGYFSADIFDRPVTDLIAATATGAWRREHDVDISALTRSRLRRVAKEYVRPGVSVPDLHQALVKVQDQRVRWTQWATSQRHPKIPTGLGELATGLREMGERLGELQEVLDQPASDAEQLRQLPIKDLQAVLDQLVAEDETLRTLPERTLVIEKLTEQQGLDELLKDFAAREVTAEQVGPELDQAWWQSALEAMLSSDDQLAVHTGKELSKIQAEFRLADGAHIDLSAKELVYQLAQAWATAAESHEDAGAFRDLLRDGEPSLEALTELGADLLQPLVPVITTSPMALAAAPKELRADAVLILDAETLALGTGLGVISRADQIVAFGDDVSGHPVPFEVSLDPVPADHQQATGRRAESVYTGLRRVLPNVALTVQHRGISQQLTRLLGQQLYPEASLDRMASAVEITQGAAATNGLTVEYLTEPGTPAGAGEDDGIESTTIEVNRVVDLVFEHFATHPNRSLAVITTTPMHARRVAEAVRITLVNTPEAAEHFDRATAAHGEPFVVVPVERAAGLVRDDVIFTLGYGRTSHGRVVHHFGPLSEYDGVEHYAQLTTRSRNSLRILSCIHPHEVELDRLSSGASLFWELLELHARDAGRGELEAGGTDTVSVDPLTDPIAAKLIERGARVLGPAEPTGDLLIWNPEIHGRDASLPDLDSGVLAEGEPKLPLAVSTDGSEESRTMSVRARSRLRPVQLEQLGWRAVSLWSIDSFARPAETVEWLAEQIGLEPEDPEGSGASGE